MKVVVGMISFTGFHKSRAMRTKMNEYIWYTICTKLIMSMYESVLCT